MNANPELPEELTDEDLAAIQASLSEGEVPAMTNTLLKIWQEILSNIETSREERITPIIANRVVGTWTKLEYSDVPAYWELYYDLMTDLRGILLDEIASDPECLNNIEDDAIDNRERYLNILFGWSDRIAEWEEQWECTSPRAHIELAAIADVARFFVGPEGLTEGLSQPQLGFSFDDDDRIALQERLLEAAAGRAQ